MVEAGNLSLSASLDTSEVERGTRRVKQEFNSVQSETLSTSATFSRLGGVVTGVIGGLTALGTTGVGALTALGLKSPVVADELANIKVSAFELGNAIGPALEPALDNINELIGAVTTGVKGGGDSLFSTVAEGITSFPLAILKDINNAMELWNKIYGEDEKKGKNGGSGQSGQTFQSGLQSTVDSWNEEGFFGSLITDVKQFATDPGAIAQAGADLGNMALMNPILNPSSLIPSVRRTYSDLKDETDRKLNTLFSPD